MSDLEKIEKIKEIIDLYYDPDFKSDLPTCTIYDFYAYGNESGKQEIIKIIKEILEN